MRPGSRPRRLLWLLAAMVPVMLACGSTTTIGAGGTPVPHKPTPTNTPAPPPPHAIAWISYLSGVPQVFASVNDGAAKQVTNLTITMDCNVFLGLPVFSPDLHHIAVSIRNRCGLDGLNGLLYVVDASTGAVTTVPLGSDPEVNTFGRAYGWIDNSTLFILGNVTPAGHGAATYSLGAGAATPLPGIPGDAKEAVVRGSTMWYETSDSGSTPQFHSVLYRYDLTAHSSSAGSIDLGTFNWCACVQGAVDTQGWDVSPDGAHVVYQTTTPGTPGNDPTHAYGIASQAVHYANADGSGVTQIAQAVSADRPLKIRFSTNGHMIGLTDASDAGASPNVYSACVNSSGQQGDPCLHGYSPNAGFLPAWHWDSGYMIVAGTTVGGSAVSPFQYGTLFQDTPGQATSTQYAANGTNVWSTP